MIKQTVLDNGVTVATNQYAAGCVALNWTLHAGADYEPQGYCGATHALEHLASNLKEIVWPIEKRGCDFAAATSHELMRMQAEVWPDMATNTLRKMLVFGLSQPAFHAEGWEREQKRILREIIEADNNKGPVERMNDEINAYMFRKAPRARSAGGTLNDIGGLTVDNLQWYHEHILAGPSVVVTAAGDVRHEQVVKEAEIYLGHLPSKPLAPPPVSRFRPGALGLLKEDMAETEVSVQYRACARHAPEKYAYNILQSMLAGDTQSYIFNKLSFQQGMVYSIGGNIDYWRDDGIMQFHMLTAQKQTQEAIEGFARQMERMPERLTARDLKRTQQQFDFALQRSKRQPSDWADQAAQDLPFYGYIRSEEEIRGAFNNLTLSNIQQAAARMVERGAFVTAMGNVADLRIAEPFDEARQRRKDRKLALKA